MNNLFFFFQAEDGIRDGRVTGVQTCALPISEPSFDTSDTFAGVTPLRAGVASYISVKVSLVSKDGSAHTLTINGQTVTRSEERRVGKESRSRWVRDH